MKTRSRFAWIPACAGMTMFAAMTVFAQSQHPLDPLTEVEIESAAKTIATSGRMAPDSLFSTIILLEPSKEEVRRFVASAPLKRQAFAVVYDWRADRTSEAIVDLAQRSVVSWKDVPSAQPPLIPAERAIVPKLVKADPRWQEAMRKRGITDLDSVAVSASAPGDPPGPGAQPARIYAQRARAPHRERHRGHRHESAQGGRGARYGCDPHRATRGARSQVDRAAARGAEAPRREPAAGRELHDPRPRDFVARLAIPPRDDAT
jgi:Cu2+-containing amine oxidase